MYNVLMLNQQQQQQMQIEGSGVADPADVAAAAAAAPTLTDGGLHSGTLAMISSVGSDPSTMIQHSVSAHSQQQQQQLQQAGAGGVPLGVGTLYPVIQGMSTRHPQQHVTHGVPPMHMGFSGDYSDHTHGVGVGAGGLPMTYSLGGTAGSGMSQQQMSPEASAAMGGYGWMLNMPPGIQTMPMSAPPVSSDYVHFVFSGPSATGGQSAQNLMPMQQHQQQIPSPVTRTIFVTGSVHSFLTLIQALLNMLFSPQCSPSP